MAATTSSTLTIGAPAGDVLAVIADLAAYPEWNGEVKRVEVLATGSDGRAMQARFEVASSGMTDEYVLDYVWAPSGVSWTLAAPSTMQKSQQGSYALTDRGATTDVTYDLTIDSRIPLIGPMRRKIEKRIVEAALHELKHRVEALR